MYYSPNDFVLMNNICLAQNGFAIARASDNHVARFTTRMDFTYALLQAQFEIHPDLCEEFGIESLAGDPQPFDEEWEAFEAQKRNSSH